MCAFSGVIPETLETQFWSCILWCCPVSLLAWMYSLHVFRLPDLEMQITTFLLASATCRISVTIVRRGAYLGGLLPVRGDRRTGLDGPLVQLGMRQLSMFPAQPRSAQSGPWASPCVSSHILYGIVQLLKWKSVVRPWSKGSEWQPLLWSC